eukprot:CAMPEP_0170143016 /NCGR_PEP_ID=MMETSP0033_2-20121228/9378_1 /TAXON_ID=195969 /ORGANISM="Dolichomastix tenuilepis, Strain CCMP3274" /LENGTH=451 /DNA_ID=CAMNT_0010379435 /DNA_START=58 /DNA_END=1413 /DNA_ORIENTATION=+
MFRNASYGTRTVWFGQRSVKDGEALAVWRSSGEYEVVVGPRFVRLVWAKICFLDRFVANQLQYLIVHGRDGTKRHVRGPCHLFRDPIVHERIELRECEQLTANDLLIVYASQQQEKGGEATAIVKRRTVCGPAVFMPTADEWIHEFSWHGTPDPATLAKGTASVPFLSSQGKGKLQVQQAQSSSQVQATDEAHLITRILPGMNCFTKLSLLQQQIYFNVRDVSTKDDAGLTVKLLFSYQVVDVEAMLASTEDPVGDLINALSTDVISFVAARTFEEFLALGDQLNQATTFPELFATASKVGVAVRKVVYRGYQASKHLQQLHDESAAKRMEIRLADLKAGAQAELDERERRVAVVAAEHRREQEALDASAAAERREAEHAQELRHARERLDAEKAHLAELAGLGVSLTQLLCAREEAKQTNARVVRVVTSPAPAGADAPPAPIHLHTNADA